MYTVYNYLGWDERSEYLTDVAHLIEQFINLVFYHVFITHHGHIDIWNKLGSHLVPIHFRYENSELMSQSGYVKCPLNVKVKYKK